MTYFGFLLRFLVVPIVLLLVAVIILRLRGRDVPNPLRGWPLWLPILAHVVIAVVYTTPWDNYLVATRVWWYDPELVTGLVIWYVPIEEYTFFVLQPIFTGLWLVALAHLLPANDTPHPNPARWRRNTTLFTGVIWLLSIVKLVSGWDAGTYLALLLVWALPPVMLQTAFGADILWKHRRVILLTLIPATIYLSIADALAIDGGTWTINPEQSLNIYLGGILPIEEAIFFFMTNLLITMGTTLMMARESQERLPARLKSLLQPTERTEKTEKIKA